MIFVLQITNPCFPDLGYQSVDAYKTLVVTVWIPFVDSNEQNGCMQVHYTKLDFHIKSVLSLSDFIN